MKILMAAQVAEDYRQRLVDRGCDVIYEPTARDAALEQAIRETACAILVVRGHHVTAGMIHASPQLSLIVRVGADVDHIDLAAASQASVFVALCPGAHATAVAELALGLILALDRRIPDNVFDLRQGHWARGKYRQAQGLKGRTLGVLGVGPVGEQVVRRARAFDLKVVGWDPHLTSDAAAQLGLVRVDLPEEVAVGCDILTVHLPLTPETERFVGPNIFDEMKTGSYFVNTSRPEIVDYDALADAVRYKHLRVGLDVYLNEPPDDDASFDHPLFHMDGVIYGTHHIGGFTDQARDSSAAEMVEIIREYLQTGQVKNCVNISLGKAAKAVLIVRLRNTPGVLAKVLNVLAQAGLNIRELDNVLCVGEQGACAQIRLDGKPTDEVLRKLQSADPDNVLGVTLTHPG